MTVLTIVRVFCDEQGRYGNPLGIVSAGADHDDAAAQSIAAAAGLSETVFVDDAEAGRVRIYVPRARVPFAGHPLVGVAWFLARQGWDIAELATDAGSVPIVTTPGSATITASAGLGVPWNLVAVRGPSEVRAAEAAGEDRHDYVWAWEDEDAGRVRARAFASSSGTVEDEATGSAALQLSGELRRPLRIVQGRGSIIDVAPCGENFSLSGRVVSDGQLTLAL